MTILEKERKALKMTIERIGPIDSVQSIKKNKESAKPQKSEGADSINLSAEAKFKAEIYHTTEMIKNTPDIRHELVEEVKKKLEDPSYISDKVIDEVAERLIDFFGIS